MTRPVASIAAMACAIVSGCAPQKVEIADPTAARTALTIALDAWRDGRTEADLLAAAPPLRATLDEWRRSGSLTTFEVLPDESIEGIERRFRVKLRLKDSSGRESPQEWPFLVGTKPGLIVLHETAM